MSSNNCGTYHRDSLTLIVDGNNVDRNYFDVNIIDGIDFYKKLEAKAKTHLKCSNWNSHEFKTTAITANGQFFSTTNERCRELIPGHFEAKQVVGVIKKTA